jgi:hypothetical protein
MPDTPTSDRGETALQRRLREARGRRSFDVAAAAAATHGVAITGETIRQWEAGRQPRDAYQVAAVERGLNLSPGELARPAGLEVIPAHQPLSDPQRPESSIDDRIGLLEQQMAEVLAILRRREGSR